MTVARLSSRQNLRFTITERLVRWVYPQGVRSVADLGFEHGWGGWFFSQWFPGCKIEGCDLWAPYAKDMPAIFKERYDKLVVCPASRFMLDHEGYDVWHAAEIVEHMPKEEGTAFLKSLAAQPGLSVVTCPLGWMPQQAIDGNPHQCHHSAWLPEELEALGYTIYATSPYHSLIVAAGGTRRPTK